MKNLKIGRKILISILFIICLFLFKNVSEVNAASTPTYRWPIGGDNANETYMDYEYYGTAGYAPVKNGKSGREYIVNNKLWPNEQYYYNGCESHYGMDITGINGHTYKVVSVVEGTVIATSAQYGGNPSTNYPERNRRCTYAGLNDGGGYGNYIIIQESSTGRCFIYGHLRGGSFKVSTGATVHVGQEIATMGSSGDSGHMHLHFEIRVSRQATLNMSWGAGYHRFQVANSSTNLDPKDYIGSTPKIIKKISLTKPAKTEYIQGVESLDLTGAKLTVEYNSGVKSTIDLPNDKVKVSGFNNSQIGKNTITVEYEGNKLTFDVEITYTPAKIEKTTFIRYRDFRQINIYFDKPVTVETAPIMTVRVGNEVKNAQFFGIDRDNKRLKYRIYYSDLDIFTSGKMYVDCTGKVKSLENQLVESDCNFENVIIGELFAYKIAHTYKFAQISKLGDVNLDGYINASDATSALIIYSKLSTGETLTPEEQDQFTRADINQDGKVDSIDATIILSYYTDLSVGLELQQAKTIIKCDYNDDECIDVNDYNLLKSAVESDKYMSKYDLNGNGILDNDDLEFFKSVIVKSGSRVL